MKILHASLLALLFTVVAFAQEDCPDRTNLCPDSCLDAQCPRFLNAECRLNPCHGLCTPNFFRQSRNVTDRCDTVRCDERICPILRRCIEEVVPSTCPDNGRPCRQYLRSRCVLPPPPADCSQITCGPGKYCRDRRGGGVKCAPVTRCRHLECNEPYVCQETEEGPVCQLDLPSTCEQADCPDGMACSVFSIPSREISIAQCVSESIAANLPVYDNQFSCSSELMICDEEREACTEVFEDGRFLTLSCNLINCPEVACPSNRECVEVPPALVQELGIGFTHTCTPPGFRFSLTCATAVDPCPAGLACHDINFEGTTIGIGCGISAQTYSRSSCQELDCPAPLECYERDTEGRGSLAQCAPEESVDVILEGVIHS